ncbi:hypothetical protein [Kiloniella sp. b19]|uniref:hypothetical protein n=1 Tax=Kiloniella sp. GXU_MW_B19 TaxID=3141326 RepID=UPI0031DDC359
MKRVVRGSRIVLVALALLGTGMSQAVADSPAEEFERDAEEAIGKMQEGLSDVQKSLENLIESLPRYGLPRFDDDGNIVIERHDQKPQQDENAGPDEETPEI